MNYGCALLIVTVVLVDRHLCSDRVPPRSKRLVGRLAAFAVLAPFLWPTFLPLRGFVNLAALVLQLAIGVYVAFYPLVRSSKPEPLASHLPPTEPKSF